MGDSTGDVSSWGTTDELTDGAGELMSEDMVSVNREAWERSMDAGIKLTAAHSAKDAEIERLKAAYQSSQATVLEYWKQVAEKDAEIARLKYWLGMS